MPAFAARLITTLRWKRPEYSKENSRGVDLACRGLGAAFFSSIIMLVHAELNLEEKDRVKKATNTKASIFGNMSNSDLPLF